MKCQSLLSGENKKKVSFAETSIQHAVLKGRHMNIVLIASVIVNCLCHG